MEAVHVFSGVDGFQDALGIHLRGRRKLNQDAVDVVIAIQVFDDGEHFESSHRGGRSNESAGETNLFASRDFAFHIELRSGIFADENGSKPGADTRGSEQAYFIFQLGENLVPNFSPVKDPRGHSQLAFLSEPQAATPMIAHGCVQALMALAEFQNGKNTPTPPVFS